MGLAGVFEDAGVVSEEALLFQKSSVGIAGGGMKDTFEDSDETAQKCMCVCVCGFN